MEKVLRSFIHEHFPLDIRVQMELISRRRDIINEEKQNEIIELLQKNSIDNFVKLGPGTNRYAFKLDGFVIKIATDNDGKIDNMKEFKMAKRLYPDVAKTYEISTNGGILIAEYIQPFSSYAEMLKYADKIRNILGKFSSVYLLGDVGISPNNYANWGLRPGLESPVCLDFAYIYEVTSEIFVCRECKSDPGILIPDKDYHMLYCTKCGKSKKFESIRGMIGNDIHKHEIGNLADEGYVLTETNTLVTLDSERSNYLELQKPIIEHDQIKSDDEYNEEIMEEEKMTVTDSKEIAKAIVAENYKNTGKYLTILPDAVLTAEQFKEKQSTEKREPAIVQPKITPKVELAFSGSNDPRTYEEDTSMMIEDVNFAKLGNGHAAISKVANRMSWSIKNDNFYEKVKSHLSNKMFPKSFYDILQAAIWKSLGVFLGCEEVKNVPNRDNQGSHTEWHMPSYKILLETMHDIPNEIPTYIFIGRMFLNKKINTPRNNTSYIDLYNDTYDDYNGIQKQWFEVLRDKLSAKLNVSDILFEKICDEFRELGWISIYDNEYEVNHNLVEKGEDIQDPLVGSYSINNEQEPEEDTLDEDLYDEETIEDIEREIESDLEEINDEADNNPMYLSVDILVGESDDYDTIRVSFNDLKGYVCIPFYTKLDDIEINESDYKSSVDNRNGVWDWLRHILPDLKFRTNDPEKWLECNKQEYIREEDDYETHFVILGTLASGEYVIGAYFFSGIYFINEDGDMSYVCDPEIQCKVNKIIRSSLDNSPISHYFKTISNTNDVQTEEYVLGLVEEDSVIGEEDNEEYIPDEESQEEEVSEEEIDEDSVEEDEEVPEEDEEDDGGRLTEAEMAALAAISSSLSSGVNATEDIQEEINNEREEGEETVEKISVVEETVVSKPHSSEEIIRGYLVERRKNKSVIRNFYYDENHVDEIIGEKGKKYINLSDENKTVYIWNGRNYIKKTTPNKKTEEVQAEDNDTIVVRRKK